MKQTQLKKVLAIVGARPQFIKHFPMELACRDKVDLVTIHTGQHYDDNMSKVFFDEFGMSRPDYMLEVGSGSHGKQTGSMMMSIEEVCKDEKPDFMLVYGDTNSTLAGALVAAKLHVPIVHVEAGLRSYNKEMPEEVNRVLTDHISDYLFVSSELSVQSLEKEGINNNIFVVGDIMKDLLRYCEKNKMVVKPNIETPFYYATLHRPYNTDEKGRLSEVLNNLQLLDKMVVFAIHPRTRHAMKRFDMAEENYSNITFIDPQGYLNNLGYLQHSDALITDSGGMQKEAYWAETKCITIRSETEWIETLERRANELIFDDLSILQEKLSYSPQVWDSNLYGDGKAADKIIDVLVGS